MEKQAMRISGIHSYSWDKSSWNFPKQLYALISLTLQFTVRHLGFRSHSVHAVCPHIQKLHSNTCTCLITNNPYTILNSANIFPDLLCIICFLIVCCALHAEYLELELPFEWSGSTTTSGFMHTAQSSLVFTYILFCYNSESYLCSLLSDIIPRGGGYVGAPSNNWYVQLIIGWARPPSQCVDLNEWVIVVCRFLWLLFLSLYQVVIIMSAFAVHTSIWGLVHMLYAL